MLGNLYVSANFVCFGSRVERLVSVTLLTKEILAVDEYRNYDAGISNAFKLTLKNGVRWGVAIISGVLQNGSLLIKTDRLLD